MHTPPPQAKHRPGPAPRTMVLCGLALALCVPFAGCRKSLFTDRDVRSQFDRYDRVRNQYEPPYLLNEFGDEVPNIRGRLAPKR